MDSVMFVIGWVTFFLMVSIFVYFLYHRCVAPYLRRRRITGEQTGTELRYTDFTNSH